MKTTKQENIKAQVITQYRILFTEEVFNGVNFEAQSFSTKWFDTKEECYASKWMNADSAEIVTREHTV